MLVGSQSAVSSHLIAADNECLRENIIPTEHLDVEDENAQTGIAGQISLSLEQLRDLERVERNKVYRSIKKALQRELCEKSDD